MIDYNKYLGKKVFLETLKKSKYTGEIISIDNSNKNGLVWIEMKGKFGEFITICNSEIAKLEEVRE